MSQFNGLPRIIVLIVLLLVLMLLFVAPPALSQAYPAMETFLGFSLNNNEYGTQRGRERRLAMLIMGYKAVLVMGILACAGAIAQSLPAPAPVPATPQTPLQILRTFRTIYIQTGTWLSKPEMLGGELQKRREFDEWGLAILNDSSADVIITVDHQPGWFYYTYRMVHQATSTVLATGSVTAWDGKQACGKIAGEIIKRIKRARSVEAR